MAHRLRPGDRVRYTHVWGTTRRYEVGESDFNPPVMGDVGTIVYVDSEIVKVVMDRPATHTLVVNHVHFPDYIINGKQAWGASHDHFKYLGWRVNPAKV